MGNNKPAFSLMRVINAIESASDDTQWFANVETGEVDLYCDPMISGIDYDEDAFEGDEWLTLPDRYDRDDWRTMCDYAYALGGSAGDELLDAIHGNGAFRNFRRTVERLGALQSWYAYKDERICELALEWLREHDCSWVDDRHENAHRDWRALLPAALSMRLQLVVLDCALSVCKYDDAPESLPGKGFCCLVRTVEELSVVCETKSAPAGAIAREDGFRALKVQGPLDFGLVGILAKISTALAEADVPLFAVSTYDTDYFLVKEEYLDTAIPALRQEDCEVVMTSDRP